MQNFLSLMAENTFAIIIAVMGFFGCLAYGIAGKGMSVLYNESLSMTASSHPFIRQLKLRRENGMRINTSIHNTQAFVLKNMERYRYLNLSIDEYVKTAWLIQLICIMLGLMSGIIKQNMWYTAYGCVCAVAVACVGKIEDIEKKESRIVVNIVDYFDNVLHKPFYISLADAEAVEYLDLDPAEFEVTELDDLKDYLYDGNAMRTLAGKKLHKKKNRLNKTL